MSRASAIAPRRPPVLLRESYRENGRVKKRTLANLSKLPDAAVEAVRRILRGEQLLNPQDAFTCLRSLPHGMSPPSSAPSSSSDSTPSSPARRAASVTSS